MRALDAITLHGMRFHTRVGVLPHEGELPQPLEVDLTVWIEARPVGGAAIDYRELYELTSHVVGRGALRFLEDAAESIATGALQHDVVEKVRVAVRKPHVALPGPLAWAEVVVERERR